MAEPATATVLLVDDDEAKRYTLGRTLRRAGFTVVEATTGEDALRRTAESPDLVILDVKLPDLSGFEVCRRIKADPATASIPVLHVSATFVQSEDRVQGLDCGADGYLADAVQPPELIASVNALLRVRRAEEKAREAARQWQTTFDAIGDGVGVLDRDGRVVRCNRALAEILGEARGGAGEGLLGRHVGDLLPDGEGRDAPAALWAKAAESRRRETAELTAAGRWLHATVDPIRDDAGALTGAVCILSDVTKRTRAERALRESEEHFRLLIEGVKDYAILMTDPDGLLVSWNTGAERLLGYAEAEILGRHVARIFTPEDRVAGVPARELATAAAEGRALDERWHQRKDGSRFWASGVVSPLRDDAGGLRGFAKVMRDATGPKRLNEVLELRARELAEADRRKDEFLAMLAHELRNPLAPIRNALEIIRLDGDPGAVSAARETAGRQVGHMTRLIDDLLDVSRITQGKIELKTGPVDLGAVIRHAVEAARPLVDAGRHQLVVRTPSRPVPIRGDRTRLEQVVANLLNNAAKYTEPGGRIELSADSDGGQVVVRVRDNGVGLTAEMLPRVFDLFAQADGTLARAQGGLGIGLTLVRNLVEMHGGRVSAASDGPGLGSEFTVRLPVAADPAAGADAAEPAPAPGPPSALRVLVVDDNVDSARSLARVLKLWGHQPRVAHGGQEALDSALAGPTDLVLLDIGLPGMDGYEVARLLLSRTGAAAPALMALTGYGQQEDRNRSRDAGFGHHLTKPVDLDELRGLLAGVVPVAGPAA